MGPIGSAAEGDVGLPPAKLAEQELRERRQHGPSKPHTQQGQAERETELPVKPPHHDGRVAERRRAATQQGDGEEHEVEVPQVCGE